MSKSTKSLLPPILLKSHRRMVITLFLFVLLVGIPGSYLVIEANSRLETETFMQYYQMSQDMVARIENRLDQLIKDEESRPFDQYRFLNVKVGGSNSFLQLSPLARFPVTSPIPGLISYFQIDPTGKITTPLLPDSDDSYKSVSNYGISKDEFEKRQDTQNRLIGLLRSNELLAASAAPIEMQARYREKTYGLLSRSKAGKKNESAERAAAPTLAKKMTDAKDSAAGAGASMMDKSMGFAADVASEADEAPKAPPAAATANAVAPAPTEAFEQKLEQAVPSDTQAKAKSRLSEMAYDSGYFSKNLMRGQKSALEKKMGSIQVKGSSRFLRQDEEKEIGARQEQVSIPDSKSPSQQAGLRQQIVSHVLKGVAEVDPFRLAAVNTGHLIAYRSVLHQGQKFIQGFILNREDFLQQAIETEFLKTPLAAWGQLAIGFKGHILKHVQSTEDVDSLIRASLLSRNMLSPPFNEMELVVSFTRIPDSSGSRFILWTSSILIFVFLMGIFLIYRLGLSQIRLAGLQHDFVSAVSHELKTPLTSIRMFSEILKQGYADEKKKSQYYDFIHQESERLSRLINNVLELARLHKKEKHADLKIISAGELITLLDSKVRAQVEAQGFSLKIQDEVRNPKVSMQVDLDDIIQIVVNLVDNAIKFSKDSSTKEISLELKQRGNELLFGVRDYGPGIPKNQVKEIFKLFYRVENEITRTTKGTGIGLALVKQLVHGMGARIEVAPQEKGVAFYIIVKAQSASPL